MAPLCVLVAIGVGVVLGVLVGVAVGFALAGALVAVALGVALAEALTMARVVEADADGWTLAVVLADAFGVAAFVVAAFVGVGVAFAVVFVAVAEGLDFSVRVGAALAFAEVVAVALGLVGVGFAVGVVAVGVGVVGVGDGVGVDDPEAGEVGDVDGFGGTAACGRGSQDSLLDVVAAFAAVLVARVRLTPEAAVTKTLPAISVTVAGRACAKRMKMPYQCCSSRYAPQWTSSALTGATRSLTRVAAEDHRVGVFLTRSLADRPGRREKQEHAEGELANTYCGL